MLFVLVTVFLHIVTKFFSHITMLFTLVTMLFALVTKLFTSVTEFSALVTECFARITLRHYYFSMTESQYHATNVCRVLMFEDFFKNKHYQQIAKPLSSAEISSSTLSFVELSIIPVRITLP